MQEEQAGATAAILGDLATRLRRERRENLLANIDEQFDEFTARISQLEKQLKDSAAANHALASRLEQFQVRAKLRKATERALYVLPLTLAVLLVAWLVARGYANTPDVAIDFNVGEIIGGLLGGVGALVAGIAYAVRRLGE